MLELDRISHRYGRRASLDGVSFRAGPGELIGLLGPNGSGKSTLLRVVAGLLQPSDGRLLVDGAEIDPRDRTFRSALGVIFQAPAIDPVLSLRENLYLAGRSRGYSTSDARAHATTGLDEAGLSDRADERADTLSGGLRRRLDLARALLHRPRFCLLDEPTTGLDEHAFRDFWSRIEGYVHSSRRPTVLVATHSPDEAERCDRLAVLHRGQLVTFDTPDELRARCSADVVELELAADADLPDPLGALPERVRDDAQHDGRTLRIPTDAGPALLGELVGSLPRDSVFRATVRRATIGDAFVAVTGNALDAEAAAP